MRRHDLPFRVAALALGLSTLPAPASAERREASSRHFLVYAERSTQSFAEQGIAPTRNAVDGLLQAFELAPQDLSLRMNVARQFLIDGKRGEARRALAPIAYDPHGGAVGQAATALIAKLDREGAKATLEALDAASRSGAAPPS